MNKILIIGLLAVLLSGCVVEDEQVEGKAWTDGIVYYEFDGKFSEKQKSKIKEYMLLWEEGTLVSFVENHDIKYRVKINKSFSQNNSNIGMFENGSVMNITDAYDQRVVVHELGHVLGLKHEHQRPDRDQYIEINWENIKDQYIHNFELVESSLYDSTNFEYDINSIMHYEPTSFSKGTIDKSFEAKIEIYGEDFNFYANMGYSPTKTDIEKINKIYYLLFFL